MWLKVKKVKADTSSWEPHLRATGCHLPYGITQCYLPPDTSERAPPNLSHAGWYSICLPRRDGRLSWPSWQQQQQFLLAKEYTIDIMELYDGRLPDSLEKREPPSNIQSNILFIFGCCWGGGCRPSQPPDSYAYMTGDGWYKREWL